MDTDSTCYPPCRLVLEESFLFRGLDQPVLEQILSDAEELLEADRWAVKRAGEIAGR